MVKRLAIAYALIAIGAVGRASAGQPPGCCACFIQDHDTLEPAFFCVSPTNGREQIAAEDRCQAIEGASLLCRAMEAAAPSSVTPECVQELRGLGIACPAHSGVPAVATTAMGGLVGALGLVGAITLRRRTLRRA